MPRELSMSLTGDDLNMVDDAERTTFIGVVEGVEVYRVGSGILDAYTGLLIPTSPSWVLVSGIFSMLTEEDVLVGMGGKVTAGDWRASFYWPMIETYWETELVRRVSTGETFTVAGKVRTGLGPPFTRGEIALKLKPNEEA